MGCTEGRRVTLPFPPPPLCQRMPRLGVDMGCLSQSLLSNVACGKVHQLKCAGRSNLHTHIDGLIAALRSESCVVNHMELEESDWPEGKSVPELLLATGHLVWSAFHEGGSRHGVL